MAAHVYVSEGRDEALVSRLAAAGAAAGATVANLFVDAAYHRSGITLASTDAVCLEAGAAAVCLEAVASLNLRRHVASHPRVGVVDHVACNPLGSATCDEAAALARGIGRRLGAAEVPVYFYGHAREDRRTLAELRRSVGYFAGAASGEWSGLSDSLKRGLAAVAPDLGPREVPERAGAAMVGAAPWVHNYNLLLMPSKPDEESELLQRCRRIARGIAERNGGLKAVEAMALPHDCGVEVACNLLDVSLTAPSEVREKVAELCQELGVKLDSDYFTNKRPEEILALLPT